MNENIDAQYLNYSLALGQCGHSRDYSATHTWLAFLLVARGDDTFELVAVATHLKGENSIYTVKRENQLLALTGACTLYR